ncbi:EAL domain-containing protein [Kineococcus sp. GCM10028916]|uniref:sensor domain-containing phosphodiesterase n=1 Tax=Kineococcus sp. GCM10028916 TaxID=3273394 RepID=UPI003635CC60
MALPSRPGGSQHAAHYLCDGVQTAALQATLTHTAHLLNFPSGAVSIANDTSLHTLAFTGDLEVPVFSRVNTPCDLVIDSARAVAIPDLSSRESPFGDPYHRVVSREEDVGASPGGDWPLLTAAGVRAYLGVPLRGREGTVVGSLCLMDTEPHPVTAAQTELLQVQAEIVEDHLDLHRRRSELGLIFEREARSSPEGRVNGRGRPGVRSAGTTRLAAAVQDLRRGLGAGEIVAHYEPIVDVVTGQVQAFEALARWHHPRRGLLHPAAFIPLAEDSDLIIDLDLAVLADAVGQLARWQGEHPELRVNVNLSGRHLAHLDCVQRIHDVVTRAGVAASSVGLEITESALIALTPQATSFVQQLRDIGFPIFFDDFGTGWASLSYLLHLPADAVKIDRSFTAALATPTGDALVRALLTLTRELGLATVVEGVGSAAAAARTRELGCRWVQGHYYSPALPAAELQW